MRAFIDKYRDSFGVEPICKVLRIASSGYWRYAAQRCNSALRSARARRDDVSSAATRAASRRSCVPFPTGILHARHALTILAFPRFGTIAVALQPQAPFSLALFGCLCLLFIAIAGRAPASSLHPAVSFLPLRLVRRLPACATAHPQSCSQGQTSNNP